MISKWHSKSIQMVPHGLPEKIVQFVRDHLVNIDCSMLALVLPMFRLLRHRVFSLHPFLSLCHTSTKTQTFYGIWKDVFLRRHVGQGILEEAFRSQTSERGHLGESIGEVRDQTPGKTLDGGVCERHLEGAFVIMQ